MHAITALYGAILFVLLTPGLILRIPSKGPLLHASIIHAILFGIIFYFISKLVHQNSRKVESFSDFKLYNPESGNCDQARMESCKTKILEKKGNLDTAWWEEGKECNGCNLIENEVNQKCNNLPHCNKSIIEVHQSLINLPGNWWDVNQACNGCTKPNFQLEKKKCDVEFCNNAIKNELAKGANTENKTPFISTTWWNTGQGCEGCTVPSAITVIPPIGTPFDNVSRDERGHTCLTTSYGTEKMMKEIKDATNEEKQVTNMVEKCNSEKCNAKITEYKNKNLMMPSTFWTSGKECEGCTLPKNNIIISETYGSNNSVPPDMMGNNYSGNYCIPPELYPGG